MKADNRISSVEALRGVAALLVTFYHLTNGNRNFLTEGFWLKEAGAYGYFGVEVFFVISGFIIPWSLYKNKYHISSFFRFLIRRSARIEIPYIASIILVTSLTFFASKTPLFNGPEYQVNIYQILSNIAYMPGFFGHKWLQPIYWTLLAEVQFYVVIGLLFGTLTGRYKWLALILLMAAYRMPFMLFPFIGLFIMGIIYFLFRAKIITCVEAGLAGFVAVIFSAYTIGTLVAFIGAASILFINYCTTNNFLLSFFGRISYSLYLTHIVIGGKIINLGIRYADTLVSKLALFVLAFFASIMFAWVFFKIVEKPAIRLSKQIPYQAV